MFNLSIPFLPGSIAWTMNNNRTQEILVEEVNVNLSSRVDENGVRQLTTEIFYYFRPKDSDPEDYRDGFLTKPTDLFFTTKEELLASL